MYNEFIVPQEINVADRIGAFTLPQIGIMSFSILISMMLLMSTMPLWLALIIVLPIFAGSFTLAFIKIHHLPMYHFLMVYAIYQTMPKNLIYRMDNIKEEYWGFEEEEIELIYE